MKGRESLNLLELPAEILEYIAKFLDNRSMLKMHQTSKFLYAHFSMWNRHPIPYRDIYLENNINRAEKVLSNAAKSPMKVLMMGNRLMQAAIISRPRYFEGTDMEIELDVEEYCGPDNYKLQIFPTISDDHVRVNMLTRISEADILVHCVSSETDYECAKKILYDVLKVLDKRPLVFFLKPSEEVVREFDNQTMGIDVSPENKRDWLAKTLIERLLMLSASRRNEMLEYAKVTFNK